MPARGAGGGGAINPQRIQAQARLPKPPAPKVFAPQHVAPRTFAPSRHSVPPPKWVGPSVRGRQQPFVNQQITAAKRSATTQGRHLTTQAARAVVSPRRPAPFINEGGLIEKGILPRIEAEHPWLAASREAQRQRAIAPYLAANRRAAEASERDAAKPHGLLNVATATLGNLPAAVTKGYANLLGTSGATGALGKILGGTASDALSIGELPLIAGIQAGKAEYHAVQGDFKPAKELGGQFVHGLTEGALGRLLRGKPGAAAQAAEEHPLFTGLEAAAGLGTVGKAAGAFARGAGSQAAEAGLRGDLARIGSRVRKPIALSEDAGVVRRGNVHQREHSGDLFRKAVQVVADKRREPMLDAKGRPVTVRDRGRQVPVLKPTGHFEAEKLQKNRANFESGRTQAVENHQREVARKEAVSGETVPGRGPLAARALARPQTGLLARVRPVNRGVLKASTAQHLAQRVATLAVGGTVRTADTLAADLAKRAGEIRLALKGDHPANVRLRALQDAARAHGDAESELATAVRARAAGEPGAQAAVDAAKARADATGTAMNEAKRHVVPGQAHRPVSEYRTAPERKEAESNLRFLEAAQHPAVLKRATGIIRQAEAHGRALNAGDAEIARLGAYPQEQLDQARLGEYALAHYPGAHATPEGIRGAGDRTLDWQAVAEHARAAGRNPDTIAYLPHRLEPSSRRSYHQQSRLGARPHGIDETRTGRLYERGANTFHPEIVQDELTAKATLAGRTQQYDKAIGDIGAKHPADAKAQAGEHLTETEKRIVAKGGHFTGHEGVEYASRLTAEGKPSVAVRAFQSSLTKEQRDIASEAQSTSAMETMHHDLLNSRIVDPADKTHARNVVVVPLEQMNARLAQLNSSGQGMKLAQVANRAFRMTVLPQPRWLTGNFMEPYLVRLPLSGSGANVPGLALDVRAMQKGIKALKGGTQAERDAAREIEAMQFGGLFVGRRGASVRRTYEDFSGRLGQAMYGAHVVRNLPVLKSLGDTIKVLPETFFHVNRVIESGAQRIAFGNQLRRDLREATGSWTEATRLGQKALDEAKRGLVNTATQHRFMEKQYELLGQYDGWSPGLRSVVQGPMPFLPWVMNSLRFVYWTVPVHHTAAFTAFVRLSSQVIGKWEEEHKDLPPGTLRAGIIAPDKGVVDVARYVPYGITQPLAELGKKGVKLGDATGGLTQTLLPQISGAQEALAGRDPFGRNLQLPGGKKPTAGQEAEIAVNSLLESVVPGLAIARRLREKGGTGYGNSTVFAPKVKPGTAHQGAVNRTLNPFRETYLKGKSASGPLSPHEEQHLEHLAERSAGHELSVKEEVALERKAEEAERQH